MFNLFKSKPNQKPVSAARKYLSELQKGRVEKSIEQKQSKGLPTKSEEIFKGRIEGKIEQQKKTDASWDQWNTLQRNKISQNQPPVQKPQIPEQKN